MVSSSWGKGDSSQENGDLIKQTLDWIANAGINGFGILPSAKEDAKQYRKTAKSIDESIDSIIRWRTAQAAGTGFITGLGGVEAMPIMIPSGLVMSYALGANTAATIAALRGYEVHSEQVRTMILLCLIGEAGETVLKNAGVAIGTEISIKMIERIPGKVLIEINKKIGLKLITKAGEKGMVNLMKLVPIVGGVVGGTFDATFVNACGQTAKKVFP